MIPIAMLLLAVLILGPKFTIPAKATSWGASTALPGIDPNTNLFPNILQTSNSSAGQGQRWVVWQKNTATSLGQVYLMTHSRYGWSGQTAIVSDSMDNIAPTLGELANGTIILAFSRGTGTYGTYDLYWMGYNGTRWTNMSVIVQATGDDFTPALTRTKDGTLWLVWSRNTSTNGGGDLYYKTYTGVWSIERILVATTSLERYPAITQTSDNKVWVLYVSNNGGNDQVWDTIWNGSSWTAPAKLTNTLNYDDYPTITQDRSGVLWVFWSRQLATGDPNNPFQYDLFYKNSTNLGTTWGAETETAFPQYTNSDILRPSIAQSWDKTLWIIYASNQPINNPYGTFNIYLLKSSLVKGHEVAVTYVKTLPTNPRQGENANIYVSIANLGDYNDTLSLRVLVNGTQIGTANILLAPGATNTQLFHWSTSGRPLAHYQVVANLTAVAGEVITQNNQLTYGYLLVSPGDVDRDGRVNIIDMALVAARFGSTRGSQLYMADADLNNDGIINILDVYIVAARFGTVG